MSSEVVEAAVEAHDKYFEILTKGYEPDDEPLSFVDQQVRKINAHIGQLKLIGASVPAAKCSDLHKIINTTLGLGDKIVETYNHEGGGIIAALHGESEEHEVQRRNLHDQINKFMLDIYSARDDFIFAVEVELAR